MLQFIYGRGWGTSEGNENESFYLYIGYFYRTISPNQLDAKNYACTVHVNQLGSVNFRSTDFFSEDGAVSGVL